MDKQTPKTFDAVEMKRQIQEQIYDETRDMTPDALLTYFRARIAKSRFASFLNAPETSQSQSGTSKVNHGI
jgi:hypothetical protein